MNKVYWQQNAKMLFRYFLQEEIKKSEKKEEKKTQEYLLYDRLIKLYNDY